MSGKPETMTLQENVGVVPLGREKKTNVNGGIIANDAGSLSPWIFALGRKMTRTQLLRQIIMRIRFRASYLVWAQK